jgi:hypothetical protein
MTDKIGYTFRLTGECFFPLPNIPLEPIISIPIRDNDGNLLGFGNMSDIHRINHSNVYYPRIECFLAYDTPERLDLDNGRFYYFNGEFDLHQRLTHIRLVPWPMIPDFPAVSRVF